MGNNPINGIDSLGLKYDPFDENVGTLGTSGGEEIAKDASKALVAGSKVALPESGKAIFEPPSPKDVLKNLYDFLKTLKDILDKHKPCEDKK